MAGYYHFHAGVISRSGEKSVSASAAYITGEKVVEERTGQLFSYPRPEGGVLASKILRPDGFIGYENVQSFVDVLEANEDRIIGGRFRGNNDPLRHQKSMERKEKLLASASTGYECIIALPKELSTEEKIQLTEELARVLFVRNRLMVLYAIHDEENNPHVHMIASMRAIDEEGNFSKAKHRYPRHVLKEMRRSVAEVINDRCQEWGYNIRVDHRSLKDQGIERAPTKHRGWYADKMKAPSRIVEENKEIEISNEKVVLKSPEELLKAVVQSKVLFTEEGLVKALNHYVKTSHNKAVLIQSLLHQQEQGKVDDVFGQTLSSFKKLSDQDRAVLIEAMKDRLSSALLSLVETRDVGSKHQMLTSDYELEQQLTSTLKAFSQSTISKQSLWRRAKSAVFAVGEKIALGSHVPEFMKDYVRQTYQGREIANQDLGVGWGAPGPKSFIKDFERREGYALNAEQTGAIDHLCSDKRLGVLLGRAGTGKSTVLSIVKDTYQSKGYQVRAAAFQGRVAEALSQEQGIESITLHKYVHEWDEIAKLERKGDKSSLRKMAFKRQLYSFHSRTVLILDEVSMAPPHILTRVLSELNRARGKAILVGDPDQLKAIGRGAAGRLAFGETDTVYELTHILRQKKEGDRTATLRLSEGRIREALNHYQNCFYYYAPDVVEDSGTVWGKPKSSYVDQTTHRGEKELANVSLTPHLGVVANFLNDLEKGRQSLMLANRQVDVDRLNDLTRQQLKSMGKLGSEIKVKDQVFYIGDRILLRQNDFTSRASQIVNGTGKVCNGAMGRVTGSMGKYLMVELDSGAKAKINTKKYDKIDLGYAITGNMAQGMTVDHAHVYLDSRVKIAADLLYVMMSRHKESLKVHMPRSFAGSVYQLMERVAAPGDVLQAIDIEELEIAYPQLLKTMESYKELEQKIRAIQADNTLSLDKQKDLLKPLYQQRKQQAKEIMDQWQQARVYMHDQGFSLDQIKIHATGKYPLDAEIQTLVKTYQGYDQTKSPEREQLVLKLSGMMEVNNKIKAGMYGQFFETACQIKREAEMITYRALLKGYKDIEKQITAYRDKAQVSCSFDNSGKNKQERHQLEKLYQERDKIASALLEKHQEHREVQKGYLGDVSYDRLQDQAARHILRISLGAFKDTKIYDHEGQILNKDCCLQKIKVAQRAYNIIGDKKDPETGKSDPAHQMILKTLGVNEAVVQGYALTSLSKLQKAFYTLRPEHTNNKALFLKRQAALSDLADYQQLEAQKRSLQRSGQLKIEQKTTKIQGIGLKQEVIADKLMTEHKRLTTEQYLLMGLNREDIEGQALRCQVRSLIDAYEQDKNPHTLAQIKELVLEEEGDIKKPVRGLLYDKGLYGEVIPQELKANKDHLEPRGLIELVNERVDLLRLAKDLITDDLVISKPHELRFRKNHSLVVNSKGWKDFMTDEGGKAYGLVQAFGAASSYKDILQILSAYTDGQTQALINSSIGENKTAINLKDKDQFREESKALRLMHEKVYAAQRAEKIKQVQALYDQSQKLQGTAAEAYLQGRGISQKTLEQAHDLRFSDQVYNSETKQNTHRALLAFARDKDNNITGVQITYLTVDGSKDTSLETSKKSLGVIKGSAVNLTSHDPNKPLLIAEGVETALSLIETSAKANVVAGLGIHNVKAIAEQAALEKNIEQKRIIVALDNDRDPRDPTTLPKHEEKLRAELNTLKETYPKTEITTIQPHTPGTDYNDILQEKEGLKQIKLDLEKAKVDVQKNIEKDFGIDR
ncbi:MAG: hypothetical protein CMM87_02095 [Rickettsiales bacterium]|nr:hypothetical protein [Rickettsiales bacterium]|tara:strand:- start:2635 stop:7884 length:5250 start_codon:yes stop_codon:yes gene_type:complete